MSTRFIEWKDAREYAIKLARQVGLPVAIRSVKEFGKYGYTVKLASINDSDFARAEIVQPTDVI